MDTSYGGSTDIRHHLRNLVATAIWHLGFVHLSVDLPRDISRIWEETVHFSDS